MDKRVMFAAAFVSRIDSLHARVKPKDKIAEIQPESQSIGQGDLLKETVELELSARLLFIVS